jgi:hypothetical protein
MAILSLLRIWVFKAFGDFLVVSLGVENGPKPKM